MVLQSIPSPPSSWAILYLGSWIRSGIPFWPSWLTLPIHTYALCILAGMIVAVFVGDRRLRARGAEPWVVLDVAILAVISGSSVHGCTTW